MRHPTARTRSSVARWRAALVGTLIAGLAMVGTVGVAAPAAAGEVPPPESTLEIVRAECDVHGGPGVLEYIVRDPAPSYPDFVRVTDSTGAIVHDATYWEGELTEFQAEVPLAQGSYTIDYTAGGETNPRSRDTQTFTITCPDLDLEVTTSCSTGVDGVATVSLTGLVEGELYGYDIVGPDNALLLSDAFEAAGTTDVVTVGALPPGNYYVYVEWRPDVEVPTIAAPPPPMFDWRGFAVEPCQPEITVEVTECTATGGTGSAVVTVSNLVAGVEYDVRLTDRGDAEGTPYGGAKTVTADADGTAQFSVSKLPPGEDFTVWVAGLWTTTPWVEPPFIGGGGNFTPIESVDLVAQADFTVKPCPAKLAATGVDGVVPLVAGALVLLGLGGAALLITRRRRRHTRDVS